LLRTPLNLTCWQLAAPTALYDPAVHSPQVAVPAVPLNEPASQSSHPSSAAFGCFPSPQTVVTQSVVVQKLALVVPLAWATVLPAALLMFHDVSLT
jgi:hypothetical protein